MNRKYFLSSLAGSWAVTRSQGSDSGNEPDWLNPQASMHPPFLKKGDRIGITSPAGYISLEAIQPAIQQLEDWGYTVEVGATIGKRDFSFGGTDEERATDLQKMLDDPHLKAILCARGGYGLIRIIDKLRFNAFKLHPKWIIGFSDITVLHNHVHRNCNCATIHSKMCNSFPSDWGMAEPVQRASIDSIRKALAGEPIEYEITPNVFNRNGKASGLLIGGNMKTIESLAGTNSDIQTKNKILFVEDTGEYLYSIDRMFWSLKRTGKLSGLKGLIIGGFKLKKDDEGEEFGRTIEQLVLEKVKEYNYPVCFDFPVGHQKHNMAMICGMLHTLEVNNKEVKLNRVS